MSKKSKEFSLTEEPIGIPINCTAYSMQCHVNNGHNNFRIMTLKIEKGVVVDIIFSDPYASFEFIDQLNTMTDRACQSLNMHWKDGLCL